MRTLYDYLAVVVWYIRCALFLFIVKMNITIIIDIKCNKKHAKSETIVCDIQCKWNNWLAVKKIYIIREKKCCT